MAQWKRLTDASDNVIDVNLDAVAYLTRKENLTMLAFVGGRTESVKETPDEIMGDAVRSMSNRH